VLPLGQFEEDAAPREQGVGEPLFEGTKAIAAFLQWTAELDAVRFPLTADRLNVVNLDSHVLDALAVLLDELRDLGLDGLVSALHQGYLGGAALNHNRVHA